MTRVSFGVAQVFQDRWVRKAWGSTPQPMPFLMLGAHTCVCVCLNTSVPSEIPDVV